MGSATAWALPCAPFAGPSVGFFMMPPVGANVWVEFEGGNPEAPIWSGCFWGVGEFPATLALPQTKVLKTDTVTVTLSDVPGAGGVTIETTDGKKIVLTALGIEINDGAGGTIKLSGPKVTVNGGALEVI
jgi:uncharacterized protein involved in type VI secretion and phage assembly